MRPNIPNMEKVVWGVVLVVMGVLAAVDIGLTIRANKHQKATARLEAANSALLDSIHKILREIPQSQ